MHRSMYFVSPFGRSIPCLWEAETVTIPAAWESLGEMLPLRHPLPSRNLLGTSHVTGLIADYPKIKVVLPVRELTDRKVIATRAVARARTREPLPCSWTLLPTLGRPPVPLPSGLPPWRWYWHPPTATRSSARSSSWPRLPRLPFPSRRVPSSGPTNSQRIPSTSLAARTHRCMLYVM